MVSFFEDVALDADVAVAVELVPVVEDAAADDELLDLPIWMVSGDSRDRPLQDERPTLRRLDAGRVDSHTRAKSVRCMRCR